MAQSKYHRIIGLICMILTSYNLCYAQQDFSEEQLAKGIEAYQCMDFEKAISYLSPIEDILVDADDENMLSNMYDIMEVLCESALIQPTLADIKNAGLELSDEQMMAIFNYSQTGIKALESFRKE